MMVHTLPASMAACRNVVHLSTIPGTPYFLPVYISAVTVAAVIVTWLASPPEYRYLKHAYSRAICNVLILQVHTLLTFADKRGTLYRLRKTVHTLN